MVNKNRTTKQEKDIILRKVKIAPEESGQYIGTIKDITSFSRTNDVIAVNFELCKDGIFYGLYEKVFHLTQTSDAKLWNKLIDILNIEDKKGPNAIKKKIGLEITENPIPLAISPTFEVSNFFDVSPRRHRRSFNDPTEGGEEHDI